MVKRLESNHSIPQFNKQPIDSSWREKFHLQATVMFYEMLMLGTLVPVVSSISDQLLLKAEREEAARQWAPIVWFHPDEHFYPGSVNYFLQQVRPSKSGRSRPWSNDDTESTLLMPSLPVGRPSQEFYLLAPHNFECSDCPLPKFLSGKKPGIHDSPPVYVTIHSCPMPPTRRESRSIHKLDLDNHKFLNHSGTIEKPLPLHRDYQSTTYKTTAPTEISGVPSPANQYLHLIPLLSSLANQREKEVQNGFKNFSVSTEQTVGNVLQVNHSHFINSSGSVKQNIDISPNDNLHDGNPSDNSNAGKTHVKKIGKATISNMNPYDIQETTINPKTNEKIPISRTTTGQFSPEATTITLNTSSMIHDLNHSNSEFFTTKRPFSYLHPETNTMTVKKVSTSTLPQETNQNDSSYQKMNIQDDQPTSSIEKAMELNHSNEKRHTPKAPVNHKTLAHEQQFSITYWMFYPYNRGKDICSTNNRYFLGRAFIPRVNDVCHGEEVTMGNHVGDWEHVSIQFKASTPTLMYVSTHTFGAYYTYDLYRHEFLYAGEDVREGIPMSPKYPRNVQLTGTHPVLYAAQGSHGLWGSAGIHQYNRLPLLQDKTGKGTAWETWLNLDIIDVQDSLVIVKPYRNWLLYEGYWGNPKTKCHIFMAGFCELSRGPTGILQKRVNFACRNTTV